MIPVQALELTKKLKELQTHFKSDPEKKMIKEIIFQIHNIENLENSNFPVALQSAGIPQALTALLKKPKVPFTAYELIYFCTVNNLYKGTDVLQIIEYFSKSEWVPNTKLKALQMFFYFVKMDLSIEVCFKMLSLILDLFVSADNDLDSITRPIVCQIVNRIISKQVQCQGEKKVVDKPLDNFTPNQSVSNHNLANELCKTYEHSVISANTITSGYSMSSDPALSNESVMAIDSTLSSDAALSNESVMAIDSTLSNDALSSDPALSNESVMAIDSTLSSDALSKDSTLLSDPLLSTSHALSNDPLLSTCLALSNDPVLAIDSALAIDCNRIFNFLIECILLKKQYFSSYILLTVFKRNEIDEIPEFHYFLKNSFSSLCIEVLKNGKKDHKKPIYSSILEAKMRFNGPYLNSIYSALNNNEISTTDSDCLNLLNFISDLVATYEKDLPFEIADILIRILKNCDFSLRSNEKAISILQNTINYLNPDLKIDNFIEILLEKVAESSADYNEIFIICLEYCAKYDLRNIFEKGLLLGYKGKVNRSKEAVVYMQKYMGSSWKIFFENTQVFSLEFLSGFSLKNLGEFIDALPDENSLGMQVFLNSLGMFKYADSPCEDCKEKTRLIEKIFRMTTDIKTLMDLIIRFYSLNYDVVAIESPMDILIERLSKIYKSEIPKYSKRLLVSLNEMDSNGLEDAGIGQVSSIPKKNDEIDQSDSIKMAILDFSLPEAVSKDLYFFINEILRTVSPSKCWNQIIGLIHSGHDCEEQKSQILLQIEQDFLAQLQIEHLNFFFFVFQQLFITAPNYQALLNAVFIFGEFTDFIAKNKRGDLWKRAITFGVDMTNSIHSPIEVKQSIIKHIFRTYRGVYGSFGPNDLEFYEKSILKCTRLNQDKKTFICILEEWKLCLANIELNSNIQNLLSFLSAKAIESDEDVGLKCFAIIEIISKNVKNEINLKNYLPFSGTKPALGSGNPLGQLNDLNEIKPALGSGNLLGQLNDLNEIKPALGSEISPVSTDLYKFKPALGSGTPLNFTKFTDCESNDILQTNSHEFKIFDKLALEQQLKAHLIQILTFCDPLKHSLISLLFLEIPTFSYSMEEIEKLSKELLRFVTMDEFYRNNATDCFIKTCSASGQFAFCMKMLSSWLSKEKVEISLSLIGKISENLKVGSEISEKNIKLLGLSNFLDYSIQFCSSEDFLVPVLDLICKCECTFDYEVENKLLSFSKIFIIKQLSVQHTHKREKIMLKYIDFISNLVFTSVCECKNQNRMNSNAGINGKEGTNINAGINGKEGTNSNAGINSKEGTNSNAGINGKEGTNSNLGINSKEGTNSNLGINGKEGTNSNAGINGKEGTNSNSGINGKEYNADTDALAIDSTSSVSNVCKHCISDHKQIALYHDMITDILTTKNLYFSLKLLCYNQMFKFYTFYASSLKIIINNLIGDYIYSYLRSGMGISQYFTAEILHVLKQIVISRNVDLINGIKLAMADLLIVNDFEILNSIRLVLKISFESELK